MVETGRLVIVLYIFSILPLSKGQWDPVAPMTYLLVLPGQDLQYSDRTYVQYSLSLTNHNMDNVNVSITTLSETIGTLVVPATSNINYNLDPALAVYGSGISNKTLIVSSRTGSFHLQVFVTKGSHTEGFTAIAMEQLIGPNAIENVYEYIVTTFCETSGVCQFSVAAAENETKIVIKIPRSVPGIKFCLGDDSMFDSSRQKVLVLNEAQLVQFESTSDLTGAHIFSYKPIVVFAGSRSIMQDNATAHTIEQLTPSSHWGTEFIVQQLHTGPGFHGDVVVITANWNNTIVTMTGFPPVQLTTEARVLYRRILPGMLSLVNASHTVQVMQISGLINSSLHEPSVAMVTVPARQHITDVIAMSCNSPGISMLLIKEKTGTPLETLSGDPVAAISTTVPYSRYETLTHDEPAWNLSLLTSQPGVWGIIKCSRTAVMPLTAVYTKSQPLMNLISPGIYPPCIDGAIVNLRQYAAHSGDLTSFSAVRLRYKSCGDVTVRFYDKTQPSGPRVVFQISHSHVIVTECDTLCNRYGVYRINCGVTLNCNNDMNAVWFRRLNGSMCFGDGATGRHAATCSPSSGRINQFTLVASGGQPVYVNYDLFRTSNCHTYEDGGWRCYDRNDNCDQYGPEVCTNPLYEPWSRRYCARTCGWCTTDSYGRQFKVVLPQTERSMHTCLLRVQTPSHRTSVSVVHDGGVLPPSTPSSGTDLLYDCSHLTQRNTYVASDCPTYKSTGLVMVYSDKDVGVTVFFQGEHTVGNSSQLNSYVAYPTDGFDHEFMTTVKCPNGGECTCGLVSESWAATVLYQSRSGTALGDILDETYLNVVYNKVFVIDLSRNTGQTVALFKSDEAFSLFCGYEIASTGDVVLNQLLPTSVWSTRYDIPPFNLNFPFTGRMAIHTNSDHNIIHITGSANIQHALAFRGDSFESNIPSAGTITVTSTNPIAVSLLIVDGLTNSEKSVVQLPPSLCFTSSVEDDVPSDVFVNFGLNVSSASVLAVAMTLQIGGIDHLYALTVALEEPGNWAVIPGHYQLVRYDESPPCVLTSVTADDLIDNDCDGKADEGSCYQGYGVYASQDDDDDGHYRNDDCAGPIISAPVQMSAPALPVCTAPPVVVNVTVIKTYPSADDFFPGFPDLCKINCTCPCSWINGLDRWNNMTDEERLLAAFQKMQEISQVLRIKKDNLALVEAAKTSATDKRESAASIGYTGVIALTLVFAGLVAIDATSLKRDALVLMSNARAGIGRLVKMYKKSRKPKVVEEVISVVVCVKNEQEDEILEGEDDDVVRGEAEEELGDEVFIDDESESPHGRSQGLETVHEVLDESNEHDLEDPLEKEEDMNYVDDAETETDDYMTDDGHKDVASIVLEVRV